MAQIFRFATQLQKNFMSFKRKKKYTNYKTYADTIQNNLLYIH